MSRKDHVWIALVILAFAAGVSIVLSVMVPSFAIDPGTALLAVLGVGVLVATQLRAVQRRRRP